MRVAERRCQPCGGASLLSCWQRQQELAIDDESVKASTWRRRTEVVPVAGVGVVSKEGVPVRSLAVYFKSGPASGKGVRIRLSGQLCSIAGRAMACRSTACHQRNQPDAQHKQRLCLHSAQANASAQANVPSSTATRSSMNKTLEHNHHPNVPAQPNASAVRSGAGTGVRGRCQRGARLASGRSSPCASAAAARRRSASMAWPTA